MSTLIDAQHLTVKRQGNTILNDVSLTISSHDFITIIGPNGAGKSMLLKCLMDFYLPDSGTITKQKNLKIGYVPQRLHPNHTMPIKVKRFLTLHKKTSREELNSVATETNIHPLLNADLFTLSGGELQRVLLARSLLGNPDLIILDEPAQNLDISGQLAFYKLIETIYEQRQLSILMVSHDLHMVMASAKQVICLYHHICCSGEPQSVTQDPEFISLFGNDMAKMMAIYQHSHNHHHTHDEDHNHA